MDLQIYGDSIMKAVLVDEQYKYRPAARPLLDQLQEQTGWQAVNRAHFGYTAERGAGVLHRDLEKGLSCRAAVLEFGGNDCDFNWAEVAARPEEEHLPKASVERFTDTLCSMVRALQSRGIQPILTTLPPLDAQKYLDFIGRLGSDTGRVLRWLGDVQMIYRWQERYSHAIARLADRLGLPLADVRAEFLSRRDYGSLIARDGIHLTQPGYELVFSTLGKTVKSL